MRLLFKKSFLPALLVIGYWLLVIPQAAWAAKGDTMSWFKKAAEVAGINTALDDSVKVWALVVKAAISFGGVIFFAFIMYAGYTWMTAMGDSEKITKAKDTLIHSTIGFVLLLSSYVIVKYLVDELVKIFAK